MVAGVWQDQDRRRALLLSAVIHLAGLLLVSLYLSLPRPEPPETFLVIDIGNPAVAEVETLAPAAAEPAPVAPTPQVADPVVGEPQARSEPEPQTVAPEPEPVTAQPEPVQAETPPEPEPEAPSEVEVPRPPTPQAQVPPAQAPPLPEAVAASALPEIDQVELEPRPLADAIQIPTPTASTEITAARIVTPTPTVEVAASAEVPQPTVSASVAAPVAVPTPSIEASVASVQAVPQPAISASVAAARPLALQPQVQVEAGRPVPTPTVRAAVALPDPAEGTPAPVAEAPAGGAEVASSRVDDRPTGGDADRPGQSVEDPAAVVAAPGAAASPEGAAETSGAPQQPPRTPFREQRDRPVAVMIDNADGYPQSGLLEASLIVEMPVEGGVSRLMTIYDRTDPASVGPVRSARPYFLEVAQSVGGVLVHAGGSPGAMAAIQRSALPTLDARDHGELFSRQSGRSAPYNLYSGGAALRQAVNRLAIDTSRLVDAYIFQPGEGAETASGATIRFSSIYDSGFRYLSGLSRYRWLRNGTPATDASGQSVLVDAVLIASIDAVGLPNDDQGRLYILLQGGPATLLLRGNVVPGRWIMDGGVTFIDNSGEQVDLGLFKTTWITFTPIYERMVLE